MGMYRKEWGCCGSVTETDAWEPEKCPLCTPNNDTADLVAALRAVMDAGLLVGPGYDAVEAMANAAIAKATGSAA